MNGWRTDDNVLVGAIGLFEEAEIWGSGSRAQRRRIVERMDHNGPFDRRNGIKIGEE